jgi:hypothetical protein
VAVLLFGLERLPLVIPGVEVSLTLSLRGKNEMNCKSIDLNSESFSLSYGGSVCYDPSLGTDGFGDEILMVEIGGFRDAKSTQYIDWLTGFRDLVEIAEIQTELDNVADIDWSAEADESAWERAVKKYESEEEAADD